MKKTQDCFVKELSIINPNIDILGAYTGAHSRIHVKCRKCGMEWYPQAFQLLQGHGCPECGKRLAVENRKGKTAKKTTEQFIQELGLINTNITVLGEYTGNRNKIDCKCDICGYHWVAIPYSLLKGTGCPNCGRINRSKYRLYTTESFAEKVFQTNPNIELLSDFTKSTESIEVKCKICGNIWQPKAYTLLQGRGCPICAKRIGVINNQGKTGLKSREKFLEELSGIDDSISVIGDYINTHTNIKCKCNRCNHIWDAKPYSLLQGHGCPRCAKSGTSFMEQFILLSFKKVFGEEKVLSRDKSLINMELDIYVPDYNIAIEPGNWWLHKKSVNRDGKKRDLCRQKQVELITVYDNYPNDEKPPFKDNCLVYTGDYNKDDHSNIRNLVKTILRSISVDLNFSEEDWDEIERKSYENALSKTHSDFIVELSAVNPTIQVLGKYHNANRRILVRCSICGWEWNAVPANLLRGDGCRKCGTRKAHNRFIKSQDEFIELLKASNPTVEIIGEYCGRHKPVRARCKLCGFEWEPVASSLIRGSSHKGATSMHKALNDLTGY